MSKRKISDYFCTNTKTEDNQPNSNKTIKTSSTQNSSISINVSTQYLKLI